MLYSVSGVVASKHDGFFVLEAAGIGFKVFANQRTLDKLSVAGAGAKVFVHFQPREEALELYGFLSEDELRFFELLISVSGVGPRSALAILGVADLKQLAAAIKESRPDVLTRASGIGRRTAERIIVELKGRVVAEQSEAVVKKMETDADLLEALISLGYRREEARQALSSVGEEVRGLEARLKAALRMLTGK